MFARILNSGSFHDVVGYVTRQFHDPSQYTPDTWRVIDSDNILTLDYRRMVQSFEVVHGFMPEKEVPAGHIAISFDIADAPRLTDEFMAQLVKEYMEGMGIKDTQYLVVRHLETDNPHFHIVYNRVNMQGKAVDERNNFKRSDKVVKAIKDKYNLTYSPLKQKYEDKIPEFEKKIRAAIYGCKSWDEFSRRLECAGIKVKFHDDRDTGKHIGVKFTDRDITVNGSKIGRAFTYRRLNNLFELNRKQEQPSSQAVQPKMQYRQPTPQRQTNIVEAMAEAVVENGLDLFKVGPGFDPEEEAFIREMRKRKKKKRTQNLETMANMFDTVKKQGEQLDGLQQKVSNNTERIETLETRSQATPPAQPAAMPEVTVVVPDNIATKESLVKLLEIAIKNQTQVTVNTISNMLKPVLKQISDLGIELDDSVIETIAQKCSDKAFSKRYSQLEDSAERLNYRISNLVNGAIWASIPRWFYVSFVVFFIAACGFGYGFFHLLNQNDRLTDVEWLYRRERTYYRTDEEKGKLSNIEREFLTGTFHEQDSIKNLIRHWEHKYGADKTYLYFNPTED